MADEVLIKVDGVSKKFCRSLRKSLLYGVSDIVWDLNPFGSAQVNNATSPSLRAEEFWALRDVTFELKRGECLGLIGRNGAGKSTLLKMLNGLIKPDAGRIEMRGRVGALIALGAGFNPILTGRENIYVNGSILGLSTSEITAKLSEIIAFAEIEQFIDSPVQTYSSGMQVRLGFAIATAMNPDILLLDEVLAVGDARFRRKCYNRIGEIRKSACMIFVSHDMAQVARTCSSALVLANGAASYHSSMTEAISCYESTHSGKEKTNLLYRDGSILSSNFAILNRDVDYGEMLELNAVLNFALRPPPLELFVTITNASGETAAQTKMLVVVKTDELDTRIQIGPVNLATGTYSINIVLVEVATNKHLLWIDHIGTFIMQGSTISTISYFPPIGLKNLI